MVDNKRKRSSPFVDLSSHTNYSEMIAERKLSKINMELSE